MLSQWTGVKSLNNNKKQNKTIKDILKKTIKFQ